MIAEVNSHNQIKYDSTKSARASSLEEIHEINDESEK